MKYLKTGVKALDKLMGGGLSVGYPHVVYGKYKEGKTILSMQIACMCTRDPKYGGLGRPALVYDTEAFWSDDAFEVWYGFFRERWSDLPKKPNIDIIQLPSIYETAKELGFTIIIHRKESKTEPIISFPRKAAVGKVKETEQREDWLERSPLWRKIEKKNYGLIVIDSFSILFKDVFECFPNDEQLLVDNTILKYPDAIQVGDILGESIVENVKEYSYTGPIIYIKPRSLLPIRITPEHRVPVVKRIWTKARTHQYHYELSDIQWKNAKELLVNEDCVVFPKYKQFEQIKTLDLRPFSKYQGKNSKVKEIELNENTAYLFGWYLAEGSATQTACLSLGINDEKYVDKLCEIIKEIGFNCSVHKDSNIIRIFFGSNVLVRFLHYHFGTNAKNKRIPDFIMKADESIVKSFLRGYLEGDGYWNDKYVEFTTTSKTVALQLQKLLSKFNILVSVFKRVQDTEFGHTERYGIGTRLNTLRQFLELPPRNVRVQKYYSEDDKNFYLPIEWIEIQPFTGKVFGYHTSNTMEEYNNILLGNSVQQNFPGRASAERVFLSGLRALAKRKNLVTLTVCHESARQPWGGESIPYYTKHIFGLFDADKLTKALYGDTEQAEKKKQAYDTWRRVKVVYRYRHPWLPDGEKLPIALELNKGFVDVKEVSA